jgi:hypothetical protein
MRLSVLNVRTGTRVKEFAVHVSCRYTCGIVSEHMRLSSFDSMHGSNPFRA